MLARSILYRNCMVIMIFMCCCLLVLRILFDDGGWFFVGSWSYLTLLFGCGANEPLASCILGLQGS